MGGDADEKARGELANAQHIERGEAHKIASAARDTLPRELVWIDTDWDR